MKILSQRVLTATRQDYRRRFGLSLDVITAGGRVLTCSRPDCPCHLPVLARARADALQQAIRWGEPYVFSLAPALLSWVVPVVDGDAVRGGLLSGRVAPDHDTADREAAVTYLAAAGCSRVRARRYVDAAVVWDPSRTRGAAEQLMALVYQYSGLDARLLQTNRVNAQQQRQIAEAIQERKEEKDRSYPIHEERMLLSLMRVGDRAGARRVLNNMLAVMFLYSPNLALIRARAIELMGFLVRAAIEDSPLQEPLMKKHQAWIGTIIKASDFENLCVVLRESLDAFIDAVSMQGYNRSNDNARRILEYIGENYTRRCSLDELAAAVGLSRFHVARLVKKATGRTVTQHVRALRVRKACDLLETTNQSCVEIACDLGFADQSYFIRQFRETMGATPARYRRARLRGA